MMIVGCVMADESTAFESVAGSTEPNTVTVSGSGQVGDSSSKTLDDVYAVLSEIRDSGASAAAASDLGATVTLDPAQYDRFSSLGGAGLQADVIMLGLLALLLGAVVATAMTLHWRGARG